MLRVLHLVQNLNYGGMERLVADMVRLRDPGRFQAHVMTLQYVGRFGEGMEAHATVHRAGRMEPWSLLRPARLARAIAAVGPDVVHTHSGVWWKGSRAARMAGVPRLVHTEHGRRHPDPPDDRWIDGWAARRTDVVAAVSAPLARHLEARVVRGRARVVVLPNGVDAEAFRPRADDGALRRELGIGPEVPVLGSVGRLEPVKGYDVAVRALAALTSMRGGAPPPVLVIAGDGSARGAVARLAAELGVAERVHLLGWRDDLHALHAGFTVFTLSSHSEGTSVSLLEAMAAGLCPVVTDVGGNADVLGPGLAHRRVPPDDPGALARGWAAALADPAAARADGDAARWRVLDGFSAAAMVRRYERLYVGDDEEGAGDDGRGGAEAPERAQAVEVGR